MPAISIIAIIISDITHNFLTSLNRSNSARLILGLHSGQWTSMISHFYMHPQHPSFFWLPIRPPALNSSRLIA